MNFIFTIALMSLAAYIAYKVYNLFTKDGEQLSEFNEELAGKTYDYELSKFHDFDKMYEKESMYYQWLDKSQRGRFYQRTLFFKHFKEYKGLDGMEVTDEVKTKVAAACAQITLGFNEYDIPTVERIFIVSSTFHSPLIDKDVNGLMMENGNIFLSWEHFEQGYESMEDKRNLALHELAHALEIEHNFFSSLPALDNWKALADAYFEKVQSGELQEYFRSYAGSSPHEFWAVSVEYFFEKPDEFKNTFSSLYHATARVLQQDTASLLQRFRSSGNSSQD
jgi:hypothetical protein